MLYQYCQADAENLDASMVFEAARHVDPLSLGLLDQVAEYMALGLVNVLMLYLPDVIVLTGGVSRSYDLLETKINSSLFRYPAGLECRHRLTATIVDSNLGLFSVALTQKGINLAF